MAQTVVLKYSEKSRETINASTELIVKDPSGNCHKVKLNVTYTKITYSVTKTTTNDGGTSIGDVIKLGGKALAGGGAIVAGVGGSIMVYGLLTGPAVPISELTGATTAAVGGIVVAIGGAATAIGEGLNWLFGGKPTVTTVNLPDRQEWKDLTYPSFDYLGQIDCPDKTDGTINSALNQINFTKPYAGSGVFSP